MQYLSYQVHYTQKTSIKTISHACYITLRKWKNILTHQNQYTFHGFSRNPERNLKTYSNTFRSYKQLAIHVIICPSLVIHIWIESVNTRHEFSKDHSKDQTLKLQESLKKTQFLSPHA